MTIITPLLLAVNLDWFSAHKDSLAVPMSALALIVAIGNTAWTQYRTSKMNKLATYQRLHEALIKDGPSQGRRLLFVAHKKIEEGAAPETAFPRLEGDPNWDRVNHALALYDTLGGYVALRLVPKRVVMQGWYHPLHTITEPVREFMKYRKSLGISRPWSYLDSLLNEVAVYECHCDVCKAERLNEAEAVPAPVGTNQLGVRDGLHGRQRRPD